MVVPATDAVTLLHTIRRKPNFAYYQPTVQRFSRSNGTCRMNTFSSFDGTTIAFHDEGQGPAVILLHGFGMDALDNYGPFDRLVPKIERRNAMLRELVGAAPPLPNLPAGGRPGLAARLQEAGARVILPDMRGF